MGNTAVMVGRNKHDPIETSIETAGFDEQNRARYSIEAFLDLEQSTAPRLLYDYWLAACPAGGGLPQVEDFQPKDALPPDAMQWVSWMDVSGDDPLAFVMHNHLANPVPGYGIELSDKPVEAIPDLSQATATAMDYLACKHAREPMYHEIEQIVGGVMRHYTRIVLPVEDRVGNVTKLYCGYRRITEPVRVKADIPADGEA